MMTPGIGSAAQGRCWSRRCVVALPRIVGRCRASLAGVDSDWDQSVDEAVGVVAEVVGRVDAKEIPETKERGAGGAPCYRGESKADRNLGRDP